MSIAPANPLGFEWQQTMFRIKDPKLSVPFYVKHFGFQLLHEMHFDEWGFSLYFLGILPAEDATSWPQPGTPEAGKRLFTMRGVTLELTWNHGTETDAAHQTNNGNVGPHRGFSSVGISARDLTALKAELVASGLSVFEAGDDCEAWMRGRTYCVDPDGYWVQLSQRPADSAVTHQLTLGSTTMRVKNLAASRHFYHTLCGMSAAVGSSVDLFAQLPPGSSVPADMTTLFDTRLELVKCGGGFPNHNGSDDDQGQIRGWGHIGFLVDDLHAACNFLKQANVSFYMLPDEGMKGIAFVLDPDGYQVEIIQKGL